MSDEFDESDHDDFDSSSVQEETGFLDLEASEASSGIDDDDSSYLGEATTTTDPFHKFMSLPLELQEMVWKDFCPDLTTNPRVFSIMFVRPEHVVLGPGVENRIQPMQTLLAVDRRTRALILKYSPHRIETPYGIVPCHMDRDILLIDWVFREPGVLPNNHWPSVVSVLANGIRNLAFDKQFLGPGHDVVFIERLRALPNLENIFLTWDAESLPTKDLTWCVGDKAHEYQAISQESENEYGNPGPEYLSIYCWPDPQKHDDPDGQDVGTGSDVMKLPDEENALGLADGNSETSSEHNSTEPFDHDWSTRLDYDLPHGNEHFVKSGDTPIDAFCRRIRVWPMVIFDSEESTRRLRKMKAWEDPLNEWYSDNSSTFEASINEYESDGIDDEPIDETLSTDDEDDLPAHLLDDSSQDSHHILGNSHEVDFPAAQFSSDSDSELHNADESSSKNHHPVRHRNRHVVDSDESEEESSTEAGSPSRTTSSHRARAVLAESEGEKDDDSDDDAPRAANGPRRRGRARALAVDSEDEDSEEAGPVLPSRTAKRRNRPIPEDSEDDDAAGDSSESQDEVKKPGKRKRNTKAAAPSDSDSESDSGSVSDSESESEEEEDEESTPPGTKRTSLAQMLRMEHRRARAALPAAHSALPAAHSDSEEEDEGENEYGAPTDDEDNNSNSTGEDGILMDMAEEGQDYDEEDD